MSGDSGRLNQFQLDLASVFFALPESAGYLLAGGGALIAQGLIDRETDDLDFFTHRGEGDVATVGDALIAAALDSDWTADTIRSGPEFRRLKITRPGAEGARRPEVVYVDLAVDSPPDEAPMVTIVGPALPPHELAIRKTLALFGRAEARDFTDVHALHQRFDRVELVRAAADADDGFDVGVFVQMLRSHRRLRDEDFPRMPVTVDDLRAYFEDWADELDQTNR